MLEKLLVAKNRTFSQYPYYREAVFCLRPTKEVFDLIQEAKQKVTEYIQVGIHSKDIFMGTVDIGVPPFDIGCMDLVVLETFHDISVRLVIDDQEAWFEEFFGYEAYDSEHFQIDEMLNECFEGRV
ncbi:hypothetical protein [Anaerolinea sp.]|uniref:hypothetical protein n=1 Tax=Anaerolinea sp. TaxID=1872519 RepID=UPI002ACED38F|nr:hypothetical protein [Anaerolinea sp.]